MPRLNCVLGPAAAAARRGVSPHVSLWMVYTQDIGAIYGLLIGVWAVWPVRQSVCLSVCYFLSVYVLVLSYTDL